MTRSNLLMLAWGGAQIFLQIQIVMQLKPSALQMAVIWIVISILVTSCGGTSTSCDDPRTPQIESCGTSHSSFGYYHSGGSSYVRGGVKGSGVSRTGFGKTSVGRSGFG